MTKASSNPGVPTHVLISFIEASATSEGIPPSTICPKSPVAPPKSSLRRYKEGIVNVWLLLLKKYCIDIAYREFQKEGDAFSTLIG